MAGDAIICSAKTNSVGPGYHAYLVNLIEDIGNRLNITWHWDLQQGDEHYQDETGYQAHKNYHQLQLEMLKWLSTLCQLVLENKGTQMMISLPIGSPRMKRDYFAVSPVSLLEKEWFDTVAGLEPQNLQWAGEEFFIWWNKDPDALFYKQSGIALLNTACPWHYPVDDHERKILTTIDQCFKQARKIDPSIKLPDEDWHAVKDFLEGLEATIPQTNYGYRKHLMTFDLTDQWLIDLPGTMYRGEDGNTIIFYDDIFTVRSLAFHVEKENSDADYAEHFFDNNDHGSAAGTEVFYSESDLAGKAIAYYAFDKEANAEYWVLQGVKVKNDKFLLSTICYPTSRDKDWALHTWNSIANSG